MKLDKAIETLKLYISPTTPSLMPDHDDALKLGIEALKRIQVIRGYPHYQWKQLLPGETEE